MEWGILKILPCPMYTVLNNFHWNLYFINVLHSRFRTFDINEADLFLLPYYAGMDYYCIGEPPAFQAPAIAEHAANFWNFASRSPFLANGTKARMFWHLDALSEISGS